MIRLHLLGSPALRTSDGADLPEIVSQAKRLALLAYLAAASPGTRHRRDTLLALLWPELDREHARASLRQTLYALRQTLGADIIQSRGRDVVSVDGKRLVCDAAEFVDHTRARRDEAALELYRGEFLKGFHVAGAPDFERWQDERRLQLEQEAVAAAWRLVDGARGDTVAARRWAARAVALAPLDEAAARRYIRILLEQGDGAAAIRAAERLEGRLLAELEIGLSPETAELVAEIRDAAAPSPVSGPSQASAVPPESSSPAVGPPALHPSGGPAEKPGGAPSGGASRAAPPDRPSVPRHWWRPGLAAVAGLAVAGALLLWGGPALSTQELDPERVLILPLRVHGATPEVAQLRHALPELVAAGLTGQGGLPHAVPPQDAFREARRAFGSGDMDLSASAAVELAHRMGAGLLLSGAVLGDGDHVTVNATLQDVAAGDTLFTLPASNHPDSMIVLASALIGPVAWAHTGVRPDRIQSVATTSRGALMAYLEGQREYRRGRRDLALAAFDRAVTLDSTFALAALALRRAGEWETTDAVNYSRALRLARRGYETLGFVDRLYLDGLGDLAEGLEWLQVRRNAVRLAPWSPDLRVLLGDFYYHFGRLVDIENADELAREQFQAALAMDSTYDEPLQHLYQLALETGDWVAARRYHTRFEAMHGPDWGVLREITYRFPEIAGQGPPVPYDSGAVSLLLNLTEGISRMGRKPVHEAIDALERRWEMPLQDPDRRSVARALQRAGLREGRPALFEKGLEGEEILERNVERLTAAMYWLRDPEAGRASADTLRAQVAALRMDDKGGSFSVGTVVPRCWLALWEAFAGSPAAARAAAAELTTGIQAVDTSALTVPELAAFNAAPICSNVVVADLAIRSGASEVRERLAELDALLGRSPPTQSRALHRWNLHVARLWLELGEHEHALRVARRWGRTALDSFLRVDMSLVEARAAEALGRAEEALAAYEQYLSWRERAEGPFVAELEDARRRYAALRAQDRGAPTP